MSNYAAGSGKSSARGVAATCSRKSLAVYMVSAQLKAGRIMGEKECYGEWWGLFTDDRRLNNVFWSKRDAEKVRDGFNKNNRGRPLEVKRVRVFVEE